MVCMVLFQVEIEDRVTLPNSQGLDSISIYLVASYDLIACAMAGSYWGVCLTFLDPDARTAQGLSATRQKSTKNPTQTMSYSTSEEWIFFYVFTIAL